MVDDVTYLESVIDNDTNSIWTDPVTRRYYLALKTLSLSDLRFWLVFSLLEHSIIKTARQFKCDRKTISVNAERIKRIIETNLN